MKSSPISYAMALSKKERYALISRVGTLKQKKDSEAQPHHLAEATTEVL